jgi:orotate phosphoribosyltransferase
LVGQKLKDGDRVVIIEDVTTAGTSVRESIPLLKAAAAVEVTGLIVSVDRMERGTTGKSALAQLHDEFGIEAFAIATLDDIVECLYKKEVDGVVMIDEERMEAIEAYRAQYGADQ